MDGRRVGLLVGGGIAGLVLRRSLSRNSASKQSQASASLEGANHPAGSTRATSSALKAPRGHAGTKPDGPDEGFYDARRGATGYSPIVATFGALTVPALVVLFTVQKPPPADDLALSSGLLIVGIFGSLIGAFGLAAIGAERDQTANLAAVIMFIAAPVGTSIFSVLGAFEVLADVYVPQSAKVFLFMEGLGVVYGVYLTAIVIGDAPTLHPRTMTPEDFDAWRSRQWLKNRAIAYKQTTRISLTAIVPPVGATITRFSGVNIGLSDALINVVIYSGLALSFVGATAAGQRSKHPSSGNEQNGLRAWEAWATTLAVALFGGFLLLVLPIS